MIIPKQIMNDCMNDSVGFGYSRLHPVLKNLAIQGKLRSDWEFITHTFLGYYSSRLCSSLAPVLLRVSRDEAAITSLEWAKDYVKKQQRHYEVPHFYAREIQDKVFRFFPDLVDKVIVGMKRGPVGSNESCFAVTLGLGHLLTGTFNEGGADPLEQDIIIEISLVLKALISSQINFLSYIEGKGIAKYDDDEEVDALSIIKLQREKEELNKRGPATTEAISDQLSGQLQPTNQLKAHAVKYAEFLRVMNGPG